MYVPMGTLNIHLCACTITPCFLFFFNVGSRAKAQVLCALLMAPSLQTPRAFSLQERERERELWAPDGTLEGISPVSLTKDKVSHRGPMGRKQLLLTYASGTRCLSGLRSDTTVHQL